MPGPSEIAATCAECGAPLDGDQRYCLECGARHGAPRVEPLQALGFGGERPGPPPRPALFDDPRPARSGRPSTRVGAALAAATLVIGGVVGAALGPGPTPSLAAAPQRVIALVVPQAPAATTTTDTTTNAPAPPPVDHGDVATPSASAGTSTTDDTTADTTTSTSTDTTDDTTSPTPATTTTTAVAATAPAHIWLIAITQADATVFAPGGVFADLAPQGALLTRYTAAAPSAAANEIALLGGQVPAADCAADLAACVLPAGETSLPDQLTSVNLTWKAYVEDAALRCAPAPAATVATSLFTTLRQRDDCAKTTVGLDALAADLATPSATPAFSLIVPSNAAASVRDLVAQITAGPAYKDGGVVVIASDAPPPAGDPAAPLAALVLSPRATPGAVVDVPTGPVALLRSFDALLGLDPLATAAQAPAGALDAVLRDAPPAASTPTTSTPSTTTTSTTRRSP